MTNVKCPQCNFVNFADAEVCKRCGSSLYVEPSYEQVKQSAYPAKQTNAAEQTQKPPVRVEVVAKKLGVIAGFMWVSVLLACVASGVQLYYAYREDPAKQAVSIGFALATAIIPYCVARAVDKLS